MGIIVVPVSVHASQIKSNFLLNAKGMSGAVKTPCPLQQLKNKSTDGGMAWHGSRLGT